MSNWREEILNKFSKTYLPLTIVSDPDGLLQDVEINRKLREQGYEIQYYSDEPSFTRDKYAFRYLYESYYRSRWDRGEQYKLLLVFGVPKKKLITSVPYDIWIKGKKHSFSLYDLFPMLSYPVISKLRSDEIHITGMILNNKIDPILFDPNSVDIAEPALLQMIKLFNREEYMEKLWRNVGQTQKRYMELFWVESPDYTVYFRE